MNRQNKLLNNGFMTQARGLSPLSERSPLSECSPLSDRNLFSGLFFAALIALAAATGCSSSASKAAPTGDTGGDTDVEVAGGDADAEAPIIVGGSIQPGVGVTLEDKEIKLGDTYAKLKEPFGEAINKHGGNRRLAAEELGVSRRTLQYKLKEYGIT